MVRKFNIPWVEGQYTKGRGVKKTMGRGSKYLAYWSHMSWMGAQNTMGNGFDTPWIGDSKYHG